MLDDKKKGLKKFKISNGGGIIIYALFVLLGLVVAGIIIAWLLLDRNKKIDVDLDNGVKAKFNATLTDTELSREKDGKLLWNFQIDEAVNDRVEGKTFVKGITGKVYRADGSYFDVSADAGGMTSDNQMFYLKNNVNVVHSLDGSKIVADEVSWDQKTEVIVAVGNVEMWKDKYHARADRAESTSAFKNIHLEGNAKVEQIDKQQEE